MAQSTTASDQRQNSRMSRGAPAADRARQSAADLSAAPGLRLHAVADAKDALLEKLALRPVRLLGRVGRDCAGLLGEPNKGRRTGRPLHGAIAGQRGGDPELLLRPVDIGDAVPAGGLISPRSQTEGPKMNLVLLGWLRPVRLGTRTGSCGCGRRGRRRDR